MKRSLLAIALCLAALSAAGQNGQTVIPVDSEIYGLVRALYIEQGRGLPSQAEPWSVAELEHQLSRIDSRALSPAGRLALERVRDLASRRRVYGEEGGFAFGVSVEASLETYWHIGEQPDPGIDDKTQVIVLPDDNAWEHGYEERLPLLRVPLEVWLFDGLYALMEIDLREEPRISILEPDKHTNVITDPYALYAHFPFRAFVAGGGPHWSVQLGRDTLSWGNGTGGNLMLSDSAGYLDFVRATTWWKAFKWTTVYAGLEPWLTTSELANDPDASTGGPEPYKAFFAHRVEARLFGTLGLSLTEATIFGRKYPDVTYLNPMMVFHNWFENQITNINMAVEAEWTPIAGLAVYAQYVLDQWQTPSELAAYPDAADQPDSYGYLFGLQGLKPAGEGWFEATLEWIHSNPWLYTERFASPLLSYTVRRHITASHRYYLDRPLGWKYGPDADSKTLTIGYRVPGRWAASLSAELRAKGSIGIEDLYPGDSEAAALLTSGAYADPSGARTPTGDHPDRRFILTGSGEISPLPFLTTGGSVAWVHISHPLGEDASPLDDAEITAFVTFRYR